MLNTLGFDLWADGYDQSVQLSDKSDEYPFAGYRHTLNLIYNTVRCDGGKKILDVGFGTGTLANRLYSDGCTVFGIDFSARMIEIARQKMPDARLLLHDFSEGFPSAWTGETFDHVICTYAIHHLTDGQKIAFIRELLGHLNPGGKILIGDVAFETQRELDACRGRFEDLWDDEEFYPVADALRPHFPRLAFHKTSCCAGILIIEA